VTAANEPEIIDVPSERRFVYRDGGGALAELQYEVRGDRFFLLHTEVPDRLGGRGLGGGLVRAAVDRAARERLTIVPWCPFARRWLKEHPDAAGDVEIDFKMPPPEA
jgi:predicted GNAT family acetyltransferase